MYIHGTQLLLQGPIAAPDGTALRASQGKVTSAGPGLSGTVRAQGSLFFALPDFSGRMQNKARGRTVGYRVKVTALAACPCPRVKITPCAPQHA